jgi:hypothetical protein
MLMLMRAGNNELVHQLLHDPTQTSDAAILIQHNAYSEVDATVLALSVIALCS